MDFTDKRYCMVISIAQAMVCGRIPRPKNRITSLSVWNILWEKPQIFP